MAFNNLFDINNAINGKTGYAYVTIDGENIQLFEIKSIEAKIDVKKAKATPIGSFMEQSRVVGISGKLVGTAYYAGGKATNSLRYNAIEMIKQGKVSSINIAIHNLDMQNVSKKGFQSVILYGFVPDSILLAKLDDNIDLLTEKFDGTFNDFEVIIKFVG